MPLNFYSMSQKRSKNRFMQDTGLCKPLCAAMVLCSWLILSPATAKAADDVEITQAVNQQSTVKGTVVDINGEPVIGASVKIEGGTTGTITDIDGNFSLSVPANAKLSISFVGYQTQVVTAKPGIPLNVVLKEDAELLDEVVVVGYGTVKRANLTGAVSSVKMNDLADIPSTNLSSVLMGTMPGVTVSEATGNPIANASIKIRTSGSWNSEPPLYVIDGFIRDETYFNMLDPSEVDNISVLKDASAAVYGVRGAGGVILVTTKRGKEGKVSVNYSGSVGFSQGISMPEMMTGYQQATALNDMWRSELLLGSSSTYNFFSEDELNDIKNVDYNWLDDAWKNAVNTRHVLNVTGGSEKVRYFIGGSYLYSDGNFSNLDVNRFSTRMGLDVNFTKDLKMSFNMSYATKSTNMPLNNKDSEAALMYGTFSDLNRVPRWLPAYIDGMPVGYSTSESDTHPLAIFDSGSYRKNRNDDMAMSAKVDYNIKWVKGLSASLAVNYNRSASNGKSIYKPYTVYNFAPVVYLEGDDAYNGRMLTNTISGSQKLLNGNSYSDGASFGYSYQLNPQLNYHIKLKDHDISAMYVYEVAESGSNALSLTAKGLVVDNVDNIQGFSKDDITGSSGKGNMSRRMSHIARLNYSWADRYLFEGTLRYEASNNFAPDYRWGLFYSLSGSWRISEENWFKDNVRGVDNLKLRVSYGRLGNDKAVLGQWRQSYGFGSGAFLLGSGTSINNTTSLKPSLSGLVALDSSWEKTDNYNVGIDLNLTNGFSIDMDGFYKHTFDILDDAKSTFPQSAGVAESTPRLNYGIQNAWGFEFGLGYQKKINQDWSVNARANFAYSMSKIIKKYQNPGIIGTWQDEEGRIRGGEVGYKVWRGNDGKGDGMARTWQDIEDYIAYLTSHTADGKKESIEVLGNKWGDLKPGMLMFEDLGTTVANGTPDGIINSNGDNCIISKFDNPPYNYSLNLGFSWKGISVSALFSGQFGNDVIFDKGFYTAASGGKRSGDFLSESSNQLAEWYGNYAIANEDGSLVNPGAKYPRLDSKSLRGERSDFWMRDGHCLRLRTLNVSYSIPEKKLSKAGIGSCRIFFTANNIWTIINPYPYKDAYVSFWSDYPQLRTFNFGINIGI